MPNPEDFESLERAIEARRAGAASPPVGDHDDLADLALQVEALGQRTPALDQSAVWARVDEYVRTTPQSTTVFGWLAGTWETFIRGGAPRLLAPAGLAALLLVGAITVVLLQSPGSASAAFVDDVRELGALTDDALLDGTLSEGELAALAALLDEIEAEAEAGILGDLDDEDLQAVAAILTVTRDQLGSQTGSGGGLASLLAGLDGINGEAAAALASNSIETALAVCAETEDDDGHEACDEALDVADDACDNLDDDAEDACEDELDEIADAADARRADDDHDDHDDDDDHDGDHDGDERRRRQRRRRRTTTATTATTATTTTTATRTTATRTTATTTTATNDDGDKDDGDEGDGDEGDGDEGDGDEDDGDEDDGDEDDGDKGDGDEDDGDKDDGDKDDA